MIRWTPPRLEDFIRLIDFRRAFSELLSRDHNGRAVHSCPRAPRCDKAWRILSFGSKMAEMSFLTHTRWPSQAPTSRTASFGGTPSGSPAAADLKKPDDCNTHDLRYWDQIQQLTVFNTAQAAVRH